MQEKQRRVSQKEKRRQARSSENSFSNVIGVSNGRFSMKQIGPITEMQRYFFDQYEDGYNIAAIGTAGTGKTMCALYLALRDVLRKTQYKKIIIIRSAVQTREQGFMPGSKAQKESIYSVPYSDIINDLFQRGDAWDILKQRNTVEFMTSSFVRGLTFDNAIVIVDECQSMTYHELDTIITRVGEDSRIIFCGDTKQDDLKTSRNRNDVSGLGEFIDVLNRIPSFRLVRFGIDDIVRSGLVKEYILAKETYQTLRIAA